MRITSFLPLVALLAASQVSRAQLLYNDALAKKSDETAKAAADVTSGTLFDKQLANMNVLEAASASRVFTTAERRMRYSMLQITEGDWASVDDVRKNIVSDLGRRNAPTPAEITKEKENLDQARGRLSTQIASLKAEVKRSASNLDTDLIATWLERLGKLDEVEALAEHAKIIETPSAAQMALLKELTATFKSLDDLYKNFKITLPTNPSVLLMQSQMEILEAQETHLKQLGLIAARREDDLADLNELLDTLGNSLAAIRGGKYGGNDVRASLDAAAKAMQNAAAPAGKAAALKELRIMTSALLMAASAAARSDTPVRLAELRSASEIHRDSIRKSAIGARSYEVFLQNGADRLALYYQGGIKPETIGRLLNSIATLGLIPAIVLK